MEMLRNCNMCLDSSDLEGFLRSLRRLLCWSPGPTTVDKRGCHCNRHSDCGSMAAVGRSMMSAERGATPPLDRHAVPSWYGSVWCRMISW